MTNEGQLTLELNVRTAEQQNHIDSYLVARENDVKSSVAILKKNYQTLVEAGFYSEDIDFKFDIVSVTREVNIGTYDHRDEVELTFDVVQGGVKLLRDEIDTKDGEPKIIKRDTWFTFSSGDKIECIALVGSYRSVKLETLVRKLKEHNENVKAKLENLTKQLSNTQKAINELNDEFPQAISIDEKQEWISTGSRYGGYTKELIEVRFEDGSYVTFEVLSSGEKRIFKVYDIEEEALTKQDKLNRLINRVKK
jgi:uncharacterized phage infection (PIP) family protein YhgE